MRLIRDALDETVPGLIDHDPVMLAKHRARALEALAGQRCTTHLTDGFCGPRDGKCQHHPCAGRIDCMREARGLLQSIESRGMRAVWIYDPALMGAR